MFSQRTHCSLPVCFLVALLACTVAIVSWTIHIRTRMAGIREVVQAIERSGGGIACHSQWDDNCQLVAREPLVATQTRMRKDADFLSSVDTAGFPFTEVCDWRYLRQLPNLRELSLTGSSVTDDYCQHLAQLKDLEMLWLDHVEISDEGLRGLHDLDSLRFLSLEGTGVTDAGLGCLQGKRELRFLNLAGTNVTDDCLSRLTSLQSLKSLDLRNTRISDEGIAVLQEALPGTEIFRGKEKEKGTSLKQTKGRGVFD